MSSQTSTSCSGHAVDDMQVAILASPKNEVNDLPNFIELTSEAYNKIYRKRCFFNAKKISPRAHDDYMIRGIVFDIHTPGMVTVIPSSIEKPTLSPYRFSYPTGEVWVFARGHNIAYHQANGYHLMLEVHSGSQVKSHNIMDVTDGTVARVFKADEQRYLIMLASKVDDKMTRFSMYLWVDEMHPPRLMTSDLIEAHPDCPIIQHQMGIYSIVHRDGMHMTVYDHNTSQFASTSLVFSDHLFSRGEIKWQCGGQLSNSEYVLFTTYNYPMKVLTYVDLFDMHARDFKQCEWKQIHVFEGEIITNFNVY